MIDKESSNYEYFKNSPLATGYYYFPHHFRMKSPIFHSDILMESIRNKYCAIQAPRGSSKSTLVSFLKPIWGILFKKYRYIVLVQNTFEKAAGTIETIMTEIRDNQDLINDFGIKLDRDAQGDCVFRHPNNFRTRLLGKGAKQIGSIRGEKFGAYRPDLIILDDVEDDEMVRSAERRKELREDFDNALMPAGDINTEYNIIGTILHYDSLMAKLVSGEYYKEYRKIIYKARYEENGREVSLWPDKWSLEWLKEIEMEKPEVFSKEFQGDPVSGERASFKREDFRYWEMKDNVCALLNDDDSINSRFNTTDCIPAIACDLAWDEKRQSDYSVILPALLTPNSDILFMEYICKKGLKPDKIEEILFSMEERLKAITGRSVPIGFEKAKLEKVVKWLLNQSMRRRNKYLWLKDVQWDTDKITRIITKLQPRYANHSIYHLRGMGDLERQLLEVPDGAHDDLPDAAQMITQLLQFPAKKKVTPVQDNGDIFFNWLKKNKMNNINSRDKERFIFGKRNQRLNEIPYEKSFI